MAAPSPLSAQRIYPVDLLLLPLVPVSALVPIVSRPYQLPLSPPSLPGQLHARAVDTVIDPFPSSHPVLMLLPCLCC